MITMVGSEAFPQSCKLAGRSVVRPMRLHEALLVEAATAVRDAELVLHLVFHHLDTKRLRLSPGGLRLV
jgi:hypothetical protein